MRYGAGETILKTEQGGSMSRRGKPGMQGKEIWRYGKLHLYPVALSGKRFDGLPVRIQLFQRLIQFANGDLKLALCDDQLFP
jgi:predicted amidohydrolase